MTCDVFNKKISALLVASGTIGVISRVYSDYISNRRYAKSHASTITNLHFYLANKRQLGSRKNTIR